MRLNRYLLIIAVLFFASSLKSQTKDDLKNQKAELEKEINYTQELLNKIRSKKTKSLNYLKLLESQIKKKEELLISLNFEISLLNKQIMKTESSIIKIEKDIISEEESLKKLRNEYAKMIYAADKQKRNKNDIVFVVSANDFNQAYKRILYLKQYSEFRKKQGIKIGENQKKLVNKKVILAQKKERLIKESSLKTILVKSKKDEIESISISKNEKEKLVKQFTKSERVFKNQIKDKQKKTKKIDDQIRKIINEELAKVMRKNGKYSFTPEALALSSEFTNNKGKLPWPLQKGLIVGTYGKQKHPFLSGVETVNNGIDIATDVNTDVRVVFDGIVSRIFLIKGEGKAILINHGEYFSVYSGLKEVTTRVGEKVFSKEKIGVVLTHEDESKTELHFEIWKGYEKQNPTKWLYNAD